MKYDVNPDVREVERRYSAEERARVSDRQRPAPRPRCPVAQQLEAQERERLERRGSRVRVLWLLGLCAFAIFYVATMLWLRRH